MDQRKQIETWKDIENYEGYYQVSNLGRIKRLERKMIDNRNRIFINKGGILKLKVGNSGYKYVNLSKNGKVKSKTVHRLVGLAFLENKNNKRCINHKDGIKTNNNISNLEWVTYKENSIHALENGLIPLKESYMIVKHNKNHIIDLYRRFSTQEIAEMYGTYYRLISEVLKEEGIEVKKKNLFSKNEIKKVKEMYKNGITQKEISKIYNVRSCDISRSLKKEREGGYN